MVGSKHEQNRMIAPAPAVTRIASKKATNSTGSLS